MNDAIYNGQEKVHSEIVGKNYFTHDVGKKIKRHYKEEGNLTDDEKMLKWNSNLISFLFLKQRKNCSNLNKKTGEQMTVDCSTDEVWSTKCLSRRENISTAD